MAGVSSVRRSRDCDLAHGGIRGQHAWAEMHTAGAEEPQAAVEDGGCEVLIIACTDPLTRIDIANLEMWSLFDHLVGAYEERFGYLQPYRFGGLQVNDEIEFGRLFDGDISRLHSP
jgi:hypothetical protein